MAATSLAVGLLACGGGEETTEDPIEARVQEYLKGPDPKAPPGPPPKELVIEDLKVGSGPVAKKGDKVAVHYIAERYDTGAQFTRRWEPDPPAVYPRLGEGPYGELEDGIEGMREGGRRQLIAPNYAQFPLIYVYELEKVEPAPAVGRGD